MNEFSYKYNKGLIFECMSLGLLIVAGLFVPQLNYIALVLAFVFIFQSDKENLLCLLIFLVSFSPIFKVTLGGFSFFNLIIMAGVLRGIVLSNLKLGKNFLLCFVLLAAYVALTGIKNGYIEIITFLCYMFLAGLLFVPGKVSVHKLVTFAILGIIITSVVGLNKNSIPRLATIMNEATIRLSAGNYYNRFSGIDANPNYYTLMLSICLAVLFVLFIDGRSKKIDYVYAGLLIVFGLMTVSQSFVVTLSISLIAVCFFAGRLGGQRALPMVVTLACVIVVAVALLSEDTINAFLFRFNNVRNADSISSVTTGRTDLSQFYMKYLFDNVFVLFFGVGIGAGNLYLGASHNYYVDILYYLGMIGGILYLIYIYNVFFVAKNTDRKPRAYQFLPLVVFLIRAFAVNLISREHLIFALMLCSAALFDFKDERKPAEL